MLKTIMFPWTVTRAVWRRVPLPWQLGAVVAAVLHFRPQLLGWEPYAVAEAFVWRCIGAASSWSVHDLTLAGVPALVVALLWGRYAWRRRGLRYGTKAMSELTLNSYRSGKMSGMEEARKAYERQGKA